MNKLSYFNNNITHCIRTFQDNEIMKFKNDQISNEFEKASDLCQPQLGKIIYLRWRFQSIGSL